MGIYDLMNPFGRLIITWMGVVWTFQTAFSAAALMSFLCMFAFGMHMYFKNEYERNSGLTHAV